MKLESAHGKRETERMQDEAHDVGDGGTGYWKRSGIRHHAKT
jgi:hypothetical protein